MKAHEALRYIASFAPLVGVVAKPQVRPNGISAIVRIRGEEEWIEPCVFSIREFADEILLLDNGASPETQKALDRLQDLRWDSLRIERCSHLDLFDLSNLGLQKACYRWVVRWDADFVAHTSGPGDILGLRRHLLDLDQRRYYVVYLPAVEVAGDFFHQFPDLRIRIDGQVHTASGSVAYVPVRRTLKVSALCTPDRVLRGGSMFHAVFESLRVPKFYRSLHWKQVSYFHVNVKSARQMLIRHFWLEWLGEDDFRSFPTLESYVLVQIRNRWGLDNFEEAAQYFMADYCRSLVPFDAEQLGPYPELLLPYLDQPGYRVVYRNGVIVGRTERA